MPLAALLALVPAFAAYGGGAAEDPPRRTVNDGDRVTRGLAFIVALLVWAALVCALFLPPGAQGQAGRRHIRRRYKRKH